MIGSVRQGSRMSSPVVQFDDLRRVHDLAANQYPHEYLDDGLGAIGLFLHDPPKNAAYRPTPTNSVTFASIGVDGIHFSSLSDSHNFNPQSPVVLTVPMELETPNWIVGESLHDFLCLGCENGYAELANLANDVDGTLMRYRNPETLWFDERVPAILKLLTDELSLVPWRNQRARFDDLQSRLMPLLQFKG